MGNQNVRRSGGLGDITTKNTKSRDQVVGGFNTLVDIVLVIDGTGSMQNLLDEVKERALSMYREIIDGLKDKKRIVKKMRIKVLIFRDIYVDTNAFEESDFYTLPEEAADFRAFVEHIRATGGGDEPESGLEALHRAIHTKWQENLGDKARQIIIVMTDASAHRLDDPQRNGDDLYPRDVPTSLAGLLDEWANVEYMSPTNHRLLVMAPSSWPWPELGMWSEALFKPTEAGCGIDRAGMDEVIAFISGSISG